MLNSKDDPICRQEDVPRADLLANPNCLLVESNYGGHCDFFGRNNEGKNERFFPKLVHEYLKHLT